jgi:hypothetical protein
MRVWIREIFSGFRGKSCAETARVKGTKSPHPQGVCNSLGFCPKPKITF